MYRERLSVIFLVQTKMEDSFSNFAINMAFLGGQSNIKSKNLYSKAYGEIVKVFQCRYAK